MGSSASGSECGRVAGVALAGIVAAALWALWVRSAGAERLEGGAARSAAASAPSVAIARPDPTRRAGGSAHPPATGGAHPAGSAAPFDLGGVIEQVHFAFREADGALRASHATHAVAVDAEGLLFTPWHHPGKRAPEARPRSRIGRGRAPVGATDRAEAVEGTPIRFAPARLARGGTLLAEGPGQAGVDGRGRVAIAKGAIEEQLANGYAGVEQSWTFPILPAGSGSLEVRVAIAEGRFVGESEGGLHFTSGALGVAYGHAIWVDALGVRTPIEARWDGGAIRLDVPAAVLEGSVYPAVLDPVIGPEVWMDEPTQGGAAALQQWASAAWNGADYLVVWEDQRPGGRWGYPDICGTRVAADGTVRDPGGIAISSGALLENGPEVACGPASCLVVWTDGRAGIGAGGDIYGARVDANGHLLDPAGFAVSTANGGQAFPRVAWGGATYLVVWEDGRSGADSDIFGARVGPDGVLADPAGIAISSAPNDQSGPALAWNGSTFFAAWDDNRGSPDVGGLYGARVSEAGALLDPAGVGIALGDGYPHDAAVASDGSGFMAIWTQYSAASDYDLLGARISGDGEVLSPGAFAISATPDRAELPRAAWNGTDYVIVWEVFQEVFAARVSPEGAVRDVDGIQVAAGAWAATDPAVACGGPSCLLVWTDAAHDGADIRGTRLDASGRLDPSTLLISSGAAEQSSPSVASDGSGYLLVWSEWRGPEPWARDVFGARLDAGGALLDASGIPISTAVGRQFLSTVAWNGAAFLVAWIDERNYGATGYDVYAARVSPAGLVLDPAGIPVTTALSDQVGVRAACGDGSCLVVWEDARGGGDDVFASRVDAVGQVLDPVGIPVAAGPYAQFWPAVARSGADYLVAWTDARDDATTGWDIRGRRVGSDGRLLGAADAAISVHTGHQRYPSVACGEGACLVAWLDLRNEAATGDDVYGARVAADGTLMDPAGIAIATAPGTQWLPVVGWDGAQFLVAWTDVTSPLTGQDVHAARVSWRGRVLEPDPIVVSGSPYMEGGVTLASRAVGQFLVAYEGFDAREGYRAPRVAARLVTFPEAPTAFAQDLTTEEDTPLPIVLAGVDPMGGPITFAVAAPPAHGTVEGAGETFTYAPAPDFNGTDRLLFVVASADGESLPAVVNVSVAPVNDPPVAVTQAATLDEDGRLLVSASDADGDALSYQVVAPPFHGALSIAAGGVTYRPAADWSGSDSFAFRASDGAAESSDAIVTVTVAAVNDPPVAIPQGVAASEDAQVAVILSGSDVDGDGLTYSVLSSPARGALSGDGASLTYTPAADFAGTDSFTFKVNDGHADSPPATVSIAVSPVNDAPVAHGQAVSVREDGTVGVALGATDVDGDTLAYTIVTPPSHGTLTGSGASLTYTPSASYSGADGFAFKANDGSLDSNVANVVVTVTPVDEPASRGCSCGTSGEAAPLAALVVGMLVWRRRRRPGVGVRLANRAPPATLDLEAGGGPALDRTAPA
jgi:MYXO-CTERM domain-containing protein